jgi:hypothetical protein
MAIKSDLEREVAGIFVENWQLAKSTVIPDPASLKLSNDARYFERCTILYADLSGSTNLVNNFRWSFAGEIYKSFLLYLLGLSDCTRRRSPPMMAIGLWQCLPVTRRPQMQRNVVYR